MKKEKLPVEENVDIEFEYKLLHIYDRIKPYFKHILAAILLFILIIIYVLYRHSAQQERENKASIYIYQIKKDIEDKKFKEAEKKIKFFEANYADTDFIKLAYAYEILIEKQKNSLKSDTVKKLKEKLSTDQSKGYFTEFEGYLFYKDKQYSKSLDKLNLVKQDNFNYLSALTLKAIIFDKQRNKEKATELFGEIEALAKNKYPYFENIAKRSL